VSWITPITDRTAADVANRTARGFLNVADINRIENNVAWLTNELRRFNIFVDTSSVINWDQSRLPTIADLQRIRNNISNLPVRAFIIRPDLSFNLQNITDARFQHLDFVTVNQLEMNLYLLRRMTDRMPIIYRQASFISGQSLFLPQRRV